MILLLVTEVIILLFIAAIVGEFINLGVLWTMGIPSCMSNQLRSVAMLGTWRYPFQAKRWKRNSLASSDSVGHSVLVLRFS